jgi:hypothetical protein
VIPLLILDGDDTGRYLHGGGRTYSGCSNGGSAWEVRCASAATCAAQWTSSRRAQGELTTGRTSSRDACRVVRKRGLGEHRRAIDSRNRCFLLNAVISLLLVASGFGKTSSLNRETISSLLLPFPHLLICRINIFA